MNSIRKILLGATAGLGVGGCMVGPDYSPPKSNMPAGFATTQPSATQPSSGPATSLERWWESFDDPTLDSLIARAVRSNLDLRIAQSRVREARAQLTVQQADIYPKVNADGGYDRIRLSKDGFYLPNAAGSGAAAPLRGAGPSPSGAGTLNHVNPALHRAAGTGGGSSNTSGLASAFSMTELDTFQGGFDASWEVDVFGGVRRSVEAAKADEAASIESRRDTMVSLLAEVARNYIDLRGAQRELQIAQENIRSQQDTVDLTRSRFQAGLATDLDVARAEAQVATTRAEVPQLRTSLAQASHRIAVLLGQEPSALQAELERESPIPAPPPEVPVGLPSDLLRRRPDIRRAERELAASNARIGAATADLFPRFSLTGSLGLASGTFRGLGRLDSTYYSVGPSVSWPIFDAGRIVANIHVQNERQAQAAAEYEAALLTSLEDVENALTAYGQERARWVELHKAVEANRRAVDLATQLYQKGLTDFLNVLDAQRNLFGSEDQLVQSERNVAGNVVALYKAMGGGWESFERAPGMQEPPEEQPVTTADH